MKLNAFVLRGMGIECEQETRRSLENLKEQAQISRVQYLDLYHLKSLDWKSQYEWNSRSWVWIPGGFSYSDDFGAGRLLAHELAVCGFFDHLFSVGAHITGVCNGFQALCRAAIFGQSTQLCPNLKGDHATGFHNQWVQLKDSSGNPLFLPVRHGEGRLTFDENLPNHVEPFLFYDDPTFDNGSKQSIAGLRARVKDSLVFGMMPHPEIALRLIDSPRVCGTSRMPKFRSELFDFSGDGTKLILSMSEMILNETLKRNF